ncbi:MAG: hypothetical protein PUG35_05715, partial [Olsenella sp.]|nr:hypothetical protein [Olsenella sp.]
YLSMQVSVPADLAEQHAIGAFFARLDNLITLHQRKQELFGTRKGAWNGVTNQLVFRTPRTANGDVQFLSQIEGGVTKSGAR